MNERPKIEEQYKRDDNIINFIVYDSSTGAGEDEVLQHKLFGTTETAHITLHPDGTVNFRIKRSKAALEQAVRSELSGYTPAPSERVKQFLKTVRTKL